MAAGEKQPLQGGIKAFAAILSLSVIGAAPVLASPDRTICENSSSPTLHVANTEFSSKQAASEAENIDMLAPGFQLSIRDGAAGDDTDQEAVEAAAEKDAETQESDAAMPADASGPLVHKRQMYRRDI